MLKKLEGLPDSNVEQYLQATADGVVPGGYNIPLTKAEVRSREELIAKKSVSLMGLEQAKKKAVAEFNEQIKPVKTDLKEATTELRNGQRWVDGNLYEIKDFENGKVVSVNGEGVIISERPMMGIDHQIGISSRASNE